MSEGEIEGTPPPINDDSAENEDRSPPLAGGSNNNRNRGNIADYDDNNGGDDDSGDGDGNGDDDDDNKDDGDHEPSQKDDVNNHGKGKSNAIANNDNTKTGDEPDGDDDNDGDDGGDTRPADHDGASDVDSSTQAPQKRSRQTTKDPATKQSKRSGGRADNGDDEQNDSDDDSGGDDDQDQEQNSGGNDLSKVGDADKGDACNQDDDNDNSKDNDRQRRRRRHDDEDATSDRARDNPSDPKKRHGKRHRDGDNNTDCRNDNDHGDNEGENDEHSSNHHQRRKRSRDHRSSSPASTESPSQSFFPSATKRRGSGNVDRASRSERNKRPNVTSDNDASNTTTTNTTPNNRNHASDNNSGDNSSRHNDTRGGNGSGSGNGSTSSNNQADDGQRSNKRGTARRDRERRDSATQPQESADKNAAKQRTAATTRGEEGEEEREGRNRGSGDQNSSNRHHQERRRDSSHRDADQRSADESSRQSRDRPAQNPTGRATRDGPSSRNGQEEQRRDRRASDANRAPVGSQQSSAASSEASYGARTEDNWSFSNRTRRGKDMDLIAQFTKPLAMRQMVNLLVTPPMDSRSGVDHEKNVDVIVTLVDSRTPENRAADIELGESLFDADETRAGSIGLDPTKKPFVGITIEFSTNTGFINARIRCKENFHVKPNLELSDDYENESVDADGNGVCKELYSFIVDNEALKHMVNMACDDIPPPESIEMGVDNHCTSVDFTRYIQNSEAVDLRSNVAIKGVDFTAVRENIIEMRKIVDFIEFYYSFQCNISKIKKFLNTLQKRKIDEFELEIAEPVRQFKSRGGFNEPPNNWPLVFVTMRAYTENSCDRSTERIMIIPSDFNGTPEEASQAMQEHLASALNDTRGQFAITFHRLYRTSVVNSFVKRMNERHQLELHASIDSRMIKFVYFSAENTMKPDRSEFVCFYVFPNKKDADTAYEDPDDPDGNGYKNVPLYVNNAIY